MIKDVIKQGVVDMGFFDLLKKLKPKHNITPEASIEIAPDFQRGVIIIKALYKEKR